MTCRELIDFLADYVAGTLDGGERARFEVHLGGCAVCLDYVRSYRDTIRLAKGALAPGDDGSAAADTMPAELVEAILDATSPRRRR